MIFTGLLQPQPFCDFVKCHQLKIVSKTPVVCMLDMPFLDVGRSLNSVSVIFCQFKHIFHVSNFF